MSTTREPNWLGGQRTDVPHLRGAESGVRNDFDVLAGNILAGQAALIVKGFRVVTTGAVGQAATSLKIVTAESLLMHPLATSSGTIHSVPADRADEILSATNGRLVGSFTPNATNYIGVDLVRTPDADTTDTVQFIDVDTGEETAKQVPLAKTTDYVIYVSTQDFSATPSIAPIAIVTTDSGNFVTGIKDARTMLFRLAQGGTAPDGQSSYTWPERSEAEDDFESGDKLLGSLKEWSDAMMTRIWELGGGEHWYSPTADRNVKMIRTGSPIVSSGDWFAWDGTNATWQGLKVVFDNSTGHINEIKDQTVSSAGLTNLADGECIYVDLDRSQNLTGGDALQPVKAALTTMGTPTVPGSRFVFLWRVGSEVFARDSQWKVNAALPPATTSAIGAVKLNITPGSAAAPVVPAIDSFGAIIVTETTGNGHAAIFGVGMATTGATIGGDGMRAAGGNSVNGNGGVGLTALGGAASGSGTGGTGISTVGNTSASGAGGKGISATGSTGAVGLAAGDGGLMTGGASAASNSSSTGGRGLVAVGGAGSFSGATPGEGVLATGGASSGGIGAFGVNATGGAGSNGGGGGVKGTGTTPGLTNRAGGKGGDFTAGGSTGATNGVAGVSAVGGASVSATAGPGATAQGGTPSTSGRGGSGIEATGGTGIGANRGGDGAVLTGGLNGGRGATIVKAATSTAASTTLDASGLAITKESSAAGIANVNPALKFVLGNGQETNHFTHLGFPTSQVVKFEESWNYPALADVYASDSRWAQVGVFASGGSTAITLNDPSSTIAASYINLTATGGTSSGLSTNSLYTRRAFFPAPITAAGNNSFVAQHEWIVNAGATDSLTEYWVGFTDTLTGGNVPDPTNASANTAAFAYQASGSVWNGYTRQGASTTSTALTGGPTGAQAYTIKMEVYGSSTEQAQRTILFYISGVLQGTIITNLPTSAMRMFFMVKSSTTGGARTLLIAPCSSYWTTAITSGFGDMSR